jgi:hypothetical protein
MMKKQRKAMSTTSKISSHIDFGCTHSIFVSPVSALVTFCSSSCAGGVRRAFSSDQVHTHSPHHAHLPAVALAKRATAHRLRQQQVQKDEDSVDDDESHNGRLNLDFLQKHPEPPARRQLRSEARHRQHVHCASGPRGPARWHVCPPLVEHRTTSPTAPSPRPWHGLAWK